MIDERDEQVFERPGDATRQTSQAGQSFTDRRPATPGVRSPDVDPMAEDSADAARGGRDTAPGDSGPGPGRSAEKEWWDDPAMPWRHKPGRADLSCLAWIGIASVFGLAMIPVRAWLLGAPERLPWLVALLGSRSGTAGLGSLVRVGTGIDWVWPILLGTLLSMKFDWVYWWAGKLWGRGMIEVWASQSARAARNYARVERWADKLGWLGIFVAYVPIPLPIMAVVFVLAGAQGWSVRRFLLLDALASLSWLLIYFVFGYTVGEPAAALLELYGRIANYVAIGLVVVVIGMGFLRARDRAQPGR
mgnify:CR=1 FL=1